MKCEDENPSKSTTELGWSRSYRFWPVRLCGLSIYGPGDILSDVRFPKDGKAFKYIGYAYYSAPDHRKNRSVCKVPLIYISLVLHLVIVYIFFQFESRELKNTGVTVNKRCRLYKVQSTLVSDF